MVAEQLLLYLPMKNSRLVHDMLNLANNCHNLMVDCIFCELAQIRQHAS